MHQVVVNHEGSKAAGRVGIVLTALAVSFLLFDGIGKLLAVAPVVEGTQELGYPVSVIQPIGVLLLLCVATYLVPRTAVLGAILITGYMGGAIATHVRIGSPLATHVLFPVYVAVLVWGGLFLRDQRVRGMVGRR
jgi:hypothetical protein